MEPIKTFICHFHEIEDEDGGYLKYNHSKASLCEDDLRIVFPEIHFFPGAYYLVRIFAEKPNEEAKLIESAEDFERGWYCCGSHHFVFTTYVLEILPKEVKYKFWVTIEYVPSTEQEKVLDDYYSQIHD